MLKINLAIFIYKMPSWVRKKREDKKSELSEIKRQKAESKHMCQRWTKKIISKTKKTKRQASRLQNTTTTYEIKDWSTRT